MFLHKTPGVFRWCFPQLTWSISTSEKVIYLTFDDGPVPELTTSVLDVLKEYEAQATFFCVGENLYKYPQIARRAIEEGHTLANHTYNHVNGWGTDPNVYLQNIRDCAAQLSALGQQRKIMRPPYGKISRSQIALLCDYDIIMWDVLSWDFSFRMTPERCLKNTIKATGKGSIVVFHDNVKAQKNMTYALPRYIDHFRSKGYEFLAL